MDTSNSRNMMSLLFLALMPLCCLAPFATMAATATNSSSDALTAGQNGSNNNSEISAANTTEKKEEKRALYVAFVFAITFRYPLEYAYGIKRPWLVRHWTIQELNRMFLQMRELYYHVDELNYIAIFPNTNETEKAAECWTRVDPWERHKFEWEIDKVFDNETTRQEVDIQAEPYEPERQLNSALLNRAVSMVAACTNEDWDSPLQKVKIVFVTNFAERHFARRNFSELSQRIPALQLPLILLALNGQTRNYHFYSTTEEEYDQQAYWETSVAVHLGVPDDVTRLDRQPWVFGGQHNWHIIYMVALSNRLLLSNDNNEEDLSKIYQQFYAVNLAIIEPIEVQLTRKHNAVLLLSPCFLSRTSGIALDMYPQWVMGGEPAMEDGWWELDKTTGCLLNARRASVDVMNPDENGERKAARDEMPISLMMQMAQTMYDRKFGATLRQPLVQDARRPMLQVQKPRLVLVTDLVDENFLQNHLPDERFEFKVYALNKTAFERYRSIPRVDFVRLLDPRAPGEIPFTKDGEEPDGSTGLPTWQLVLLIVAGVVCASLLLLVHCAFYARSRCGFLRCSSK